MKLLSGNTSEGKKNHKKITKHDCLINQILTFFLKISFIGTSFIGNRV